jgi:hypothetical protein
VTDIVPQPVRRSWPMLVNPHASKIVVPFGNELTRRQQSMGFWPRDWWRNKRDAHRAWRRMRRFFRAVYREFASAPKKTVLDLLIALLLGLLAIPGFRDWFFRFKYSWLTYAVLIVARVIYGVWHRANVLDTARDEAGRALRKMLPVIECTSIHVAAQAQGHSLPPLQLQRNIETVLSAIADLAAQTLHVPEKVRIGANLMLPMPVMLPGETEPTPGCGIVAYDSMPANPSWTRLPLGEFGAGRVFTTGKVQGVWDMTDPVWCGLFKGNRSKCFASFPVRAGTGDVIAVVNVDATHLMVLTKGVSEALFADVLSAPLKLLGDLLVAASV